MLAISVKMLDFKMMRLNVVTIYVTLSVLAVVILFNNLALEVVLEAVVCGDLPCYSNSYSILMAGCMISCITISDDLL